VDELKQIIKAGKAQQLKITVLGGGSNTIIATQGIRGIGLICRGLTEIKKLGDTRFYLGAGLSMAKVAKTLQEANLTRAEFMIGIPGTLGGAVAMNAGAMGQETAEMIESVDVFLINELKVETWPLEKLHFAYRKSAVNPEEHIVVGATLSLKHGDPIIIEKLMQQSLSFRQAHHPKEPNGGSVFKNPNPEQPAGKLLDGLGAKAWQEGGAFVSPMHANFIVNLQNATALDILRLMIRMKRSVWKAYQVCLFPENRFVGDALSEETQLLTELKQDYAITPPINL
jgi:UDP-N-acetylmuramate dehydrogenase